MNATLYLKTAVRLLLFFPIAGLVLFVPAGTLTYWEAWLFVAVFFTCNVVLTAYLALADPHLLERRLKAGPTAEHGRVQKVIVTLALIWFAGLAVLPALDHRFGWSDVPTSVVLLGNVLVALAYVVFWRVLKANPYGAATIQVEPDQPVVSTGPYGVVRHPMYSASLILCVGMALALGSWWGLLALLPGLVVLAWRLLEEEAFLHQHLPGYTHYTHKVRWRLLPGVF